MMGESSDVDQLIADAKLVANYGVRAGRLVDGSLTAEIAAADAAVKAGTPDLVRSGGLASALNSATKAIAPVTLLDLDSKWRPFPQTRFHSLVRVTFALFAAVIIAGTAYYTQMYTQTNFILGQLTDIQTKNEVDKSERLYRFFVLNHKELFPPSGQGTDAAVFEQYLQSYEDLLSLDSEQTTFMELSCEVIARANYMLGVGQSSVACGQATKFYTGRKDYGPYAPPAKASPGKPATVPAVVASAAISALAPVTASQPKADDAGQDDTDLPSLTTDQQDMSTFLYQDGITGAVNRLYATNYLPSQIYNCQQLVALLGVWILPLLYGIFGATVFQMRAILNPLVPDPPPERLILRLVLGGFAGVVFLLIFGASPQKISEGTSIDIGAFGLAFLLGFSVDIFFSILDRLVAAASQSLTQSK